MIYLIQFLQYLTSHLNVAGLWTEPGIFYFLSLLYF
jgi:hypothetical protein